MEAIRILWIDDEIELLKPHIMFLESKGYEVIKMSNGVDAIDFLRSERVDLVFLDEQMPGMSGLETLIQIKELYSFLPVIMVTKSEEENIMEEALGSKISDYLVKPVNTAQILLAIKKQLDSRRLVDEKNSMDYQREFRAIGSELSANMSYEQWEKIYKKLINWELELENHEDPSLLEILSSQKREANILFSKYIENNYKQFLLNSDERDFEMSHTVLRKKLFPLINDSVPVFFIVIDNLRYDHWRIIKDELDKYLSVLNEGTYMSILPSVTHYARNSMFSGLLPSEIEKKYPQFWVGEDSEERKNQYEKDLLEEYLKRYGRPSKVTYNKVLNQSYGIKILDYLPSMMNTPLNVIIYNFVDMLSHASTEIELLREMVSDDKSYRSLVQSWIKHSSLIELIKSLSEKRAIVVISTDHGSTRVSNPLKIRSDREASVNLRYKVGRNLEVDSKSVYYVRYPEEIFLPKQNNTSSFVFAKDEGFFVYPNSFNQYVSYYKDSIQHGGISLEEMIVPFVILQTK